MSLSSEPNASTPSPPTIADPQGQAALALVESLIYKLLETGNLSGPSVLDLIQRAIDAQGEIAAELYADGESLSKSIGILTQIQISVQIEAGST